MNNFEELTQYEIVQINGGNQKSYDFGYRLGEAIGNTIKIFSLIRLFI